MTVDKGFFPSENYLPTSQGRKLGNTSPLGNDIVDWQLAKMQTQKLRPRSLEKICTPVEMEIILNDKNQLKCFWKIWAAKETAYKAWQGFTKATPVFNPKAFRCQVKHEHLILVNTPTFSVNVTLGYTPKYIFAFIKKKDYTHHIYSRKDYLKLIEKLNAQGWFIKKSKLNIPSFQHHKNSESIPVSLSHDADLVAVLISKRLLRTVQ